MEDINAFITQNYQENIAYFENHHPQVHQKLLVFEKALDAGHYKEKYELIYENDAFDVLEETSTNTLYNKQTNNYAKLAQESVNQSKDKNAFCGLTLKDDALLHMLKPTSNEIQKLSKFIFFGVGLGVHIFPLHEKFSFGSLLLVEDDLELFRLSLFTLNYALLAQTTELFFCVFEDDSNFLTECDSFLQDKPYLNHIIKFFTMLNQDDAKIKAFSLALARQAHLTFLHQDMLKHMILPAQNICKPYKFLTHHSKLKHIQKPFLLLGAGPSLQKNMDFLKKHHQDFVIVALSATTAYLEEHAIHADIITHLDAFDAAYTHFEKIQDKDYFSDSLCLFSAKTSQKILSHFPSQNIYLFEDATHYKKSSLKPSSPCVGSLSYQLLLLLEVQTLYLLGIDLSIDSVTGATHSSSHTYTQNLDLKKTFKDDTTANYKASLLEIRGNTQEKVLTTPHFFSSIEAINTSTLYLKKSTQVFNLSDGAYFEGMQASKLPDITNTQKEEQLKIDAQIYDNSDLLSLKNKLYFLQKIHKSLQKKATQNITSTKQLEKIIVSLYKMFHDEKLLLEYEIYKVLDSYILSVSPYIFDFLNQKDKLYTQKELTQVHTLFREKLLEVLAVYIKTLQAIPCI